MYYLLEYFQNMIIFIIVIPTYKAISVPHGNKHEPSQGEEGLKRKMFPGIP